MHEIQGRCDDSIGLFPYSCSCLSDLPSVACCCHLCVCKMATTTLGKGFTLQEGQRVEE